MMRKYNKTKMGGCNLQDNYPVHFTNVKAIEDQGRLKI